MSLGLPSNFSSEESRQQLFDALDRDRDGCVTFDDLNSYLQNWSIRELRVRTAAMRQDAETRKLKRMAELLAATMANRLGLGADGMGGGGLEMSSGRAASVSGGRPRSVSDMASPPPSSLNGSGIISISAVNAGGQVGSSRRGGGAPRPKPAKSHIQRQIDDLVLQSLALAAESSEINAKRRKLNVVNEKLDRELVKCERERMRLLTSIAEVEAELRELQASGAMPAADISSRLSAIDAELHSKRESISIVTSRKTQLEASAQDLAQRQAELGLQLSHATDVLPATDAFIAKTKETTAKVERALDSVQPIATTPAAEASAAHIEEQKAAVERKLAALSAQVAEVEAQRSGLLADQQTLRENLLHTQEEQEARRQKVQELDLLVPQLQSSIQQLERERAALERRGSTAVGGGNEAARRAAELQTDLQRKQEILLGMNSEREQMSLSLREMEQQHSALTRRHVEISTQLTNINQQISILFDGQLYERRNSFGETAHDGVSSESLPVPCVASVECEMDGKKTTGLLNVSNYILMYESRIATYVGRGLGGQSPEHQSPPSSSSPVVSSRRASINANTTSFSESTRFCVDISDVVSVRFIHANDDDGHGEEGYEDEGLSELESSLKEPSIATIIIQLRSGYHNRFFSSDSPESDEAAAGAQREVITPPNSAGGVGSRHGSLTMLGGGAGGVGIVSLGGSPRGTTVACFGDYDSLKRVDKSLRLFMQLIEAKGSAASPPVSSLALSPRAFSHSVPLPSFACVSVPAVAVCVALPPTARAFALHTQAAARQPDCCPGPVPSRRGALSLSSAALCCSVSSGLQATSRVGAGRVRRHHRRLHGGEGQRVQEEEGAAGVSGSGRSGRRAGCG